MKNIRKNDREEEEGRKGRENNGMLKRIDISVEGTRNMRNKCFEKRTVILEGSDRY